MMRFKKLEGLPIVIFDTETTGTEEKDRLIEVGGFFIESDGETFITSELCNHKEIEAIPTEATEVHGITMTQLKAKSVGSYHDTRFAQKLKAFDKLAGESGKSIGGLIIAHNADFDLGMLKKEGIEPKNLVVVDTLRIAKHLYQDKGVSHRLQYLKHYLDLTESIASIENHFGISASAHSALGDVIVLSAFVDYLCSSVDLSAEDMVKMTNAPVELKYISFGKYKGDAFTDIAKKDSSYLDWLYRQEIDKDLKYTIEVATKRR